MKFKLGENLDRGLAALFAACGHEADSVVDEGLSARPDAVIYQVCSETGRVLITLDLDFSNPLRFPPDATPGIVILRPHRPILRLIQSMLVKALPDLTSRSVAGKLWIVEPGRLRVYDPGETTGSAE